MLGESIQKKLRRLRRIKKMNIKPPFQKVDDQSALDEIIMMTNIIRRDAYAHHFLKEIGKDLPSGENEKRTGQSTRTVAAEINPACAEHETIVVAK